MSLRLLLLYGKKEKRIGDHDDDAGYDEAPSAVEKAHEDDPSFGIIPMRKVEVIRSIGFSIRFGFAC
jgi:hypothetical protein